MTRMPLPMRLFGCLAGLLVISECLFGQATPPSADTFVSSLTPKANYGPSIILVVQQGANSYLQFNLSALPAGAHVSKAQRTKSRSEPRPGFGASFRVVLKLWTP